MNDTLIMNEPDLDIPASKISTPDLLVSPKPLEGVYPLVAEQLEEYGKKRNKEQFVVAMFRTGKLAVNRGKRPHRPDGTKYTSVPTAQRKIAARSKSKIQKASRQKNRVK